MGELSCFFPTKILKEIIFVHTLISELIEALITKIIFLYQKTTYVRLHYFNTQRIESSKTMTRCPHGS